MESGSSNSATTALETLNTRRGVCHLSIALCRAINVPARMVVGFLHQLHPMDLHAWFEACVDGRWFTFDATEPMTRGSRIVIAYGRDAADVALATMFGNFTMQSMCVTVTDHPAKLQAKKHHRRTPPDTGAIFRLRGGLVTRRSFKRRSKDRTPCLRSACGPERGEAACLQGAGESLDGRWPETGLSRRFMSREGLAGPGGLGFHGGDARTTGGGFLRRGGRRGGGNGSLLRDGDATGDDDGKGENQ